MFVLLRYIHVHSCLHTSVYTYIQVLFAAIEAAMNLPPIYIFLLTVVSAAIIVECENSFNYAGIL